MGQPANTENGAALCAPGPAGGAATAPCGHEGAPGATPSLPYFRSREKLSLFDAANRFRPPPECPKRKWPPSGGCFTGSDGPPRPSRRVRCSQPALRSAPRLRPAPLCPAARRAPRGAERSGRAAQRSCEYRARAARCGPARRSPPPGGGRTGAGNDAAAVSAAALPGGSAGPDTAGQGATHQVQRKKMYSLGKVNQIKDQEKPHWKQYLQLRTKFGLYKEERVYLKRIPLTTSCEKPDERVCSSNSLERKNDSCPSSSLDVTITDQHRECIKEEKIILDLEEGLSKKRKTKSSLHGSGKRRKTSVKSATSSRTEVTGPSSTTLNRSVSPPPALLQESISTDFISSTDAEQEPCSQSSDVIDSDIPVLVSCEDHASLFEGSFRDDAFPLTPPDLDETIRDEKIKRLKQLLREREAALEEMRKKNAANLKY
ncbi:ligand-dependent nuclear receptor-interacting factor 1 [Phasianus colchicus]|uniref:ligand-dependent nuclear receptor-interacting factor 1 n=1 Tax=Phasianus colchicus TaxID=9054 RepID=UPI00129EE9E5|nr:ligand-dependent nuclear receptor-interacting factor 1 [Phasianus colchicus]